MPDIEVGMQSSLVVLLMLSLASPLAAQAPVDTAAAALQKALQKTAIDYEKSLRNTAPHRLQRASYCDEQVGRFCVVYDVGQLPALPPEPPEVKKARAAAIAAFQKGVALWPDDSLVVAPLIRFLVEDERPAEAVELARNFLKVSKDPS